VRIIDVPASHAAVLRFKGPYAEIEAAYAWMYGTWLPQSGQEPANLPGLEEYLNDPRTTPPADLLTDIILPLAKLRVSA
jgi:AraC family transcriptional regulator